MYKFQFIILRLLIEGYFYPIIYIAIYNVLFNVFIYMIFNNLKVNIKIAHSFRTQLILQFLKKTRDFKRWMGEGGFGVNERKKNKIS